MPDRNERSPDLGETLRMSFEYNQRNVWTALPGIVQSYPGTGGYDLTVDVQPAINGYYFDQQGNKQTLKMPLLLDCPLLFQGGGGMTATFPVAQNDECLVIIASRCIDNWFQQGGVQDQAEFRMHDLSDGFALVGVRSQPRKFTLDQSNMCLINDAGDFYFKMNPTTKAMAGHAAGGINLNGVMIDQNGNVTIPQTLDVTGNVTGHATITGTTDVVGGGKSLKTHTHSGVQTGGGTSGPPT